VGSLTSHNPIGLQGLLRGQLYFFTLLVKLHHVPPPPPKWDYSLYISCGKFKPNKNIRRKNVFLLISLLVYTFCNVNICKKITAPIVTWNNFKFMFITKNVRKAFRERTYKNCLVWEDIRKPANITTYNHSSLLSNLRHFVPCRRGLNLFSTWLSDQGVISPIVEPHRTVVNNAVPVHNHKLKHKVQQNVVYFPVCMVYYSYFSSRATLTKGKSINRVWQMPAFVV
jgi:hypothetical protein